MKKILLSFVCLLAMALPSLAATKTYQLVTDPEEILNPDNEFLMISSKLIKNGVSAALNSDKGNATTVLSNVSEVPETITLDAESLGLGLFSVKENGDDKVLYETTTGKYWGLPNSNGINATVSFPTLDNYKLTIVMNDDHTVKVTSPVAVDNRALYFNGTYFRCYKPNDSYSLPYFYKEVEVGPQTPAYKGFEQEYSLEIGQSMPFPNIFPSELSYTFTTEETDVVKIDPETKTLTALAEGVAMITFSTEATDSFLEGEGEFLINVTKKTPKLSFHDQIVYGKLNVGVVWQAVTIEDPENADERGTITYSSSNSEVLDVDPITGQIYPDKIYATGEAIITATIAEMGDYAEGSASYKILIKDPEEDIEPGTAVFDFTVKDAYGFTTMDSKNNKYESVVSEIEENDIVTISFEGEDKYRLWENNGSVDLRLYKDGGKFTVAVPEGYKISAIGMSSSDKKIDGTYSPLSGPSDFTPEDGWKSYWHADDQILESVTFTANATTRIDKIFVLYEAATSGLKSAKLSFDPVVNGIIVDEEATINAAINPTGREITYGIQNLSEDEYIITPSEDGKTLKVLVNTPGYYTLEAKSAADDEYRDGYAIMRLNVFRHLDVFANEVELTEDVISTEDGDVEVTFNIPELANVYYQIVEGDEIPGVGEEDIDDNQEAGFEIYEDGITIPANTRGKLVFYIANYGYKSPKRTIILEATEPLVTPKMLGLDEVEIGEMMAGVYEVKSDHALEVSFDYVVDPDSPVQLVYMIQNDELDIEDTYNGESLKIDQSCAMQYYLVNSETFETSDPVIYMFEITLPEPVAPELPELKAEGAQIEDGFINCKDNLTINFEVPEGIHVYYSLGTAVDAPKKAHGDADEHKDFTKHTGEDIELTGAHKTLSFYACDPATGLHSDITTYTLNIATGIADIDADDPDAIYFNLQGVQIAKPENGLYIRVQKGKSEKMMK